MLRFGLEYVDWNKGKFKSTGGNIADDVFSIVPAISWRPTAQTVFRFNYRYNWQKDILGNPPSKLAGFQFGVSYLFREQKNRRTDEQETDERNDE